MTDHKQAAIEALQQMTLTGKRQLTPAQAKECVEGAIPHIRAMIAQEIRAVKQDSGALRPLSSTATRKTDFANDFEWAALIAEGNQK